MQTPGHLGHEQFGLLVDFLRFGILLVTHDLELIYNNQTVSRIFDNLSIHAPNGIPQALINYCNQFMEEADEYDTIPLIIDCQPRKSRLLRWQISWLSEAIPEAQGKRCMLVVVEDCYNDLLIQMQRDQRRYGLTDQEAKVWVMLKFGMSYQEIADNLSIKLNTVKTHARNIYNKQRNHRPQAPRLWFLEDAFLCNNTTGLKPDSDKSAKIVRGLRATNDFGKPDNQSGQATDHDSQPTDTDAQTP